jgi:hypothetical protein
MTDDTSEKKTTRSGAGKKKPGATPEKRERRKASRKVGAPEPWQAKQEDKRKTAVQSRLREKLTVSSALDGVGGSFAAHSAEAQSEQGQRQ